MTPVVVRVAHAGYTVIRGRRVDLAGGRWAAASHGPHPVDLDRLAAWVEAGCPDPAPVRQGFTVFVADPRRERIWVATGARLEACAYYSMDGDDLLVSTDLRALLLQMRSVPSVDAAALLSLTPTDTPFVGVHRLPTGHLLTATAHSRTIRGWFDPRGTFTGSSARAVALMRETVRDAVRLSLPTHGTVAACVSGGLDSTLVAGLAAQEVGRRHDEVLGVSHAPVASPLSRSRSWDASDEAYATAMNSSRGIHVTVLRNERRVSPLTAMEKHHETTALPVMNPGNLVWLHDIADWVRARGATLLLQGNTGNATLSRDQQSAVVEMAQRRQWLSMIGWIASASRLQRPRAVAGIARRALLSTRLSLSSGDGLIDQMPLAPAAAADLLVRYDRMWPPAEPMAARWRRFIRSDPPFGQSLQGHPGGLWWSDPLSDPEVVRLAMSLPAHHWLAGGRDRGLARQVGRGVVPEDVRLRVSRGMQAADLGLWWSGDMGRLAESLERIEASPTAVQFADLQSLRAGATRDTFADPWRSIRWQNTHGRVLGAALFAAHWDEARRVSLSRRPARGAQSHGPAGEAAAVAGPTPDREP